MSARRHDAHLLTGAYAADALDGAERSAFERHLARCASCAEEVRGLREAVARLGTATAVEPPARMRERTLAAAASTRQLPPVTPARLARRVPRFARRTALVRPAVVTAAAAAIAALAVFQVSTAHQLDQAQARNSAIAAVLAAPGASMETSGTKVGGRVTVVVSPRDHQAVITAADLPSPPGTRVYQLWVINASGARSAGLLPRGGAASPVLADSVRPGDHLGITVEPAGGTTQPTTPPIVLVTARSGAR
ncbi:MAG: anti-sigma factor [Streptosporangiales bacterium]|nr:anti-sigma factor [Streptosporangiales bacterium]